jgi:enamine deaminase RidA (YjgF/YER057c/UK114 family)
MASSPGRHVYLTTSLSPEHVASEQAMHLTYRQLASLLVDERLEVFQERVFGSLGLRRLLMDCRRRAMRELGLDPDPEELVTYVEGQPLGGPGVAGVQLWAVRRRAEVDGRGQDGVRAHGGVSTILDRGDQGEPCGRGLRVGGATWLALSGLHGVQVPATAVPVTGRGAVSGQPDSQTDSDCCVQVVQMFARADNILRAQGASLADVVRTWIYIDRILDRYAGFNQARTRALHGSFGGALHGVGHPLVDGSPRGLPASTGIGARNSAGAACVMDLLAVVGRSPSGPEVEWLVSPKQSDPLGYGSAFSRGIRLRDGGTSIVQLSGTAAVGVAGESLCPGDARGQMRQTLRAVVVLLSQAGATLDDLGMATLFFKRPQDAALFDQAWAAVASGGEPASTGGQPFAGPPAVRVVADVCREELLFEIDGLAVLDG